MIYYKKKKCHVSTKANRTTNVTLATWSLNALFVDVPELCQEIVLK